MNKSKSKLLLLYLATIIALFIPMDISRAVDGVPNPKADLEPKKPLETITASVETLERVLSDCETEIKRYAWDFRVARAVAMAESRLNPSARGDTHLTYFQNGIRYGDSWGCFQVRYLPGRPTPDQLTDPAQNVKYAYQLYQANGWSPWTMFKNGGYRSHL